MKPSKRNKFTLFGLDWLARKSKPKKKLYAVPNDKENLTESLFRGPVWKIRM